MLHQILASVAWVFIGLMWWFVGSRWQRARRERRYARIRRPPAWLASLCGVSPWEGLNVPAAFLQFVGILSAFLGPLAVFLLHHPGDSYLLAAYSAILLPPFVYILIELAMWIRS